MNSVRVTFLQFGHTLHEIRPSCKCANHAVELNSNSPAQDGTCPFHKPLCLHQTCFFPNHNHPKSNKCTNRTHATHTQVQHTLQQHPPATHSRNTITQHTHTTHSRNTLTQHTHATHSRNTLTQHTHATHSRNTLTQHTHATHSRNTLTQHTHATHSHNTLTQLTHATHSRNTLHAGPANPPETGDPLAFYGPQPYPRKARTTQPTAVQSNDRARTACCLGCSHWMGHPRGGSGR